MAPWLRGPPAHGTLHLHGIAVSAPRCVPQREGKAVFTAALERRGHPATVSESAAPNPSLSMAWRHHFNLESNTLKLYCLSCRSLLKGKEVEVQGLIEVPRLR